MPAHQRDLEVLRNQIFEESQDWTCGLPSPRFSGEILCILMLSSDATTRKVNFLKKARGKGYYGEGKACDEVPQDAPSRTNSHQAAQRITSKAA